METIRSFTVNFLLLIPCTVGNRFTEIKKYTCMLTRYLHYNVTLNTATCFGPQGAIIRKSNQSNAA